MFRSPSGSRSQNKLDYPSISPGGTTFRYPPGLNFGLVGVVVVLGLVVIGLVVYLVVSRNDTSSGNQAGPPAVSPVAADQALAVSIDLHRWDLPTGWTVGHRAASFRSGPANPADATGQ